VRPHGRRDTRPACAPLAWWLAAPAEPAAALAFAAAALIVWKSATLWDWGQALADRTAAAWPGLLRAGADLLPLEQVRGAIPGEASSIATLAALAPLAWFASRALARWAERLVAPRARPA